MEKLKYPVPEIAVITCYFGVFPKYFELFLHSCKYNSSIDFFLITDNEIQPSEVPANVLVVYMKFSDMQAFMSSKLGFQVKVNHPYKMCDFKPAYGVIFQDLIKKYDFWGHSDLDIIYGNIRQFITADLLRKNDVISVRPDWLTGCFALYRNNPVINKLFTMSKDYLKVFQSDRHFCFDETNFTHDDFNAGREPEDCLSEIDSMTHVIKRLNRANTIRAHFDLFIIEGLPGRLVWEGGTLTYRNRFEVLLYHMIYFKTVFTFNNLRKPYPKKILITPSTIKFSKENGI